VFPGSVSRREIARGEYLFFAEGEKDYIIKNRAARGFL
jgi:hypothetical protein